MKKSWVFLSLFIGTVFVNSSAFADDLKIAVVDMQSILKTAPQISVINNRLNKEFKPRQDKIRDAQTNLQTELTNLEKNSPTMKNDDKTNLENKIVADRNNVQNLINNFQQDLGTAQNKALQDFNKELTTVVEKISEKSHFDLVIQKSVALYARPNFDITSQVLDGLQKS